MPLKKIEVTPKSVKFLRLENIIPYEACCNLREKKFFHISRR